MSLLPYSKWVSVPLHIRSKISEQFGIAKVRSTHVSNDVVVDDGYNVKDVENAVSSENLQKHLGTDETDILVLFQMLVDKMEGRIIAAPDIQGDMIAKEILDNSFTAQYAEEPVKPKKVIKKRTTKKN